MGPLPGETAVSHVVTVVGGVDDDGVFRESLLLESFKESTDGSIDAADHAEVGAHVCSILLVGVPAPEEAFAIDGGFEEIRLALEDGRIAEARGGDLVVLIHAVSGARPGEVSNAGTSVAVFRVTSVEPHIQSEGLVFRVSTDEIDPAINDDLSFVAKGSVGLLLVKGISPNGFELVEMSFSTIALRHFGVPLAEITGAITVLSEDIRIELIHGFGTCEIALSGGSVGSPGQTGEDRGAAYPTDGVADKHVVEASATFGQLVDVGRLDQGMPVATQRAGRLVVREEEDDIGSFSGPSDQGQRNGQKEGETRIHDVQDLWMGRYWS